MKFARTKVTSGAESPSPLRGRLMLEWAGLILLATVLVVTLTVTGATTRLDNGLYDFALRLRVRPPPTNIVIVGFDPATIDKQGEWPWPRQFHAKILNNIARDRPKSIVFDVLLPSKGTESGDEALRKATADAHVVYLPELLDEGGQGQAAHLLKPKPEFAAAAAGLGRGNPTPDSDGIVRRAVLFSKTPNGRLPHLMLVAAGRQATESARAESGRFNGADEILIPYLMPRGKPEGAFELISAQAVFDNKVGSGYFRNKYVLIGATAPRLLDNYPSPLTGAAGMANVEIDANILDAVLRGVLVRVAPVPAQLAMSLGLIWAFCVGILRLSPRQLIVQGVGGGLACLVGVVILLIWPGLWIPPGPLLITGTLLQVVWSSRRLQAASDYLGRELADLQTRAGGAILPSGMRPGPIIGDSVSRQVLLIEETRERIRGLRRFVNDVLANFPDPVMVVSARGRILMFNQAATLLAQSLGRSTELGSQVQPILKDLEVAAGDDPQLWPPPTTPGAEAPRGVGPGGRILEARYTTTGEAHGQARGWTIQLVDVTGLVSAMRQREEALKLFTHDMRAPQSAILAALAHSDFQGVPATLRDSIEKNALRTISLADGWVRLAQAESAEYTFEPIDLFHTLSDAADALWPNAQAAKVELVVPDPGREFVVEADRGMMSRALINLIDNAIKASAPGRSVVCALAQAELHGRPAVALTVADQAAGMSKDQRERLFKRFAQTTTHGADGRNRPVRFDSIGLGLAVVHTVVTRHNGRIECDSEEGVGTTFTISLPLYEDEEAAHFIAELAED